MQVNNKSYDLLHRKLVYKIIVNGDSYRINGDGYKITIYILTYSNWRVILGIPVFVW
jgi:hypothetical protein